MPSRASSRVADVTRKGGASRGSGNSDVGLLRQEQDIIDKITTSYNLSAKSDSELKRSESAKAPYQKRMEGDFTNGIHGSAPHFKSSYSELGQIPGWRDSDALMDKHLHCSMPVFPKVVHKNSEHRREAAKNPFQREGDHTLGYRGPNPDSSTYITDIGRIPGWKGPQSGADKHLFCSMPTFPKIVHKQSDHRQNAAKLPKRQEGDQTLGYRGPDPEFMATYWDLGQIPNFKPPQGKRYNFQVNADRVYRFATSYEHRQR